MDDKFKKYEALQKEMEDLKRENDILRQENGKMSSMIDEHSQTADKLRESEQKYRLLVDSSNEAIVVIKDGILRLANPSTRILTGYSEEELEVTPFQLFIHPDDRAKVANNHLRRLRGENVPSYYVFRLITKDGSTRWVYMNAVLIDWEGNPATLNFLTDITGLKIAEEALQQSSQKWEAVISASPDGIGMITIDGKIQLISDKLVKMHGYEDDQMDDILGRSIFDFIDKEDHKLLIENTHKLLAGEKGDRLTEYRAIKKDKSKFYIDVNASILHDPNGNPTSILYVERDITERILAEAKIKNTNQELEKLNSEKDKLFSIIAHDLRSPFHGLLGLTEVLAEESHKMSSGKITEYSKLLHGLVVNLYSLLENLLEWGQLQKDSIGFAPKNICLSAVFSQSSNTIKQRALLKGIYILNEIPENLEIYADDKMINSVFRNLLSNAVKYTNKGGKVVAKTREIEDGAIEISVSDTGVGIPGNIIEKLFMLGEKVSTTGTENEPSTGLGLILCKEFVEKHGGKIWVESKENIGSTFYFTIPGKDIPSQKTKEI
jgi:PAS domain S-box-containing protein